MNINYFTGNSFSGTSAGLSGSAGGTTASQASTATSAATQMLQKLAQRVQTNIDSTKAQLSTYGLLKSALSNSQLKAQALTKLSPTSTAAQVTQSAAEFFNAFNGVASSAKSAASGTGPASASQSATRIGRDMQRALNSSPAMTDALKTLGLRLQSDGTLVHDAKKFAAALQSDPAGVRAALAKVGQKVDSAAANELANSGNVAGGLSSLAQYSTTLTAQQKALQQAVQASQTPLSTGATQSGLAAYASQSAG